MKNSSIFYFNIILLIVNQSHKRYIAVKNQIKLFLNSDKPYDKIFWQLIIFLKLSNEYKNRAIRKFHSYNGITNYIKI